MFVLTMSVLPAALRAQTTPTAEPSPSQSAPPGPSTAAENAPALPRGKKLLLKNGSFQLVREYELDGDRVRYYSLDSSQWEQIPAELVDWEATKKAEEQEAAHDATVLAKIQAQEAARRADPLDIDASLEVAPAIFLPPGEGLFVFDGKSVLRLAQVQTASRLAKKRLLEQVLVPVPVVPSSHTISIPGTRAKFRLRSAAPEFYMRTADAREPEIELLRAKIRGQNRQIENTDELFGEHQTNRDTVALQRWQVAQGVYRFTLAQPLPPGEYALAEIVKGEDISLYVWDLGVDAAPPVEHSSK